MLLFTLMLHELFYVNFYGFFYVKREKCLTAIKVLLSLRIDKLIIQVIIPNDRVNHSF